MKYLRMFLFALAALFAAAILARRTHFFVLMAPIPK